MLWGAGHKLICNVTLSKVTLCFAFMGTLQEFTYQKLPYQTVQTNVPKGEFFSVRNQLLLSLTYFKTEPSQLLCSSLVLGFYCGYSKYFLARKVMVLPTPLPFSMTSVKWNSKIAVSRCPFCLVLSFTVENMVLAFTSVAGNSSNSSTSVTNKVISQVSLPNPQDWPEGNL